jgi:AcrR family transcriptional regulator
MRARGCQRFETARTRRSGDGMTDLAAQSLAAQLRARRSEMMISEVEAVALRMFETSGFDEVTVDGIASEAHISARTFYRYFPTKEDVLQVQIDRRSQALRAALSGRPVGEPPLRSLRVALAEVVSTEDQASLRRWITVIAATPSVVKGVIGGIQLKTQRVIAQFLGARFDMASDALVPTMLAAAVAGVIQAAHTQWFVHGGDLPATISEGIEVLERGIGSDPTTWAAATGDGSR